MKVEFFFGLNFFFKKIENCRLCKIMYKKCKKVLKKAYFFVDFTIIFWYIIGALHIQDANDL